MVFPDRTETGGALAVVLAAGYGRRLRPLTDDRSKAMLPVAGTPMVERVLEMLACGGCDHFIVVVHPGDQELIALLRQPGWQGRVELAYQEQRLGMAHALGCAAHAIHADGASGLILASCDNVYPEDHLPALMAKWREPGVDAVLTLMRVQAEQIPTLAVVAMEDGRVTRIVEKPCPQDAPSDLGVPALYAVPASILAYLPQVAPSPRGEYEFQDALQYLISDGGRVGGVLTGSRMTLTQPMDLLALTHHFLRKDRSSALVAPDVPADAAIVPPVRVEMGVGLGRNCRIGPEVSLETGCRIGDGASVRRAVLLRGADIGAGAVVEDEVVG